MTCTAGDRCGTYTGYVNEGGREARCRPCRDAAAAYQRRATRLKAYGKWEPFTDAGPVRAHVRALMDAGLKITDIMEVGGVGKTAIQRLLYGRPSKGEKPSTRVRHRIADAILAVPVPDDDDIVEDVAVLLERGVTVPPEIRRHLSREAMDELILTLTRHGYSADEISGKLGVTDRTVVRRRTAHREAAIAA